MEISVIIVNFYITVATEKVRIFSNILLQTDAFVPKLFLLIGT
jgi:hypothetical protein